MQRLEMPITPYVRTDVVIVGHELVEQGRKRAFNMVQAADGNDDDGARQGSDCSLSQDAVSLAAKSLRLYVRNQHGAACPMPFLQSVKFSFTVRWMGLIYTPQHLPIPRLGCDLNRHAKAASAFRCRI